MNDKNSTSTKLLNLNKEGKPNNSDLQQNWSEKLGPPSLICRNLKSLRKTVPNRRNFFEI